MNKERFETLVNEFKNSIKENKNYGIYNEDVFYHSKYKNFKLIHFVFYAMLRRKKPEKVTHSVDSFKYKKSLLELKYLYEQDNYSLQLLKGYCSNYDFWYSPNLEEIYKSIELVFSSITREEINEVLEENYKWINNI